MKVKEQILTNHLQEILKRVIQNETQKLPVTFETLKPKERLNILCKLMLFIFPKVEAVHTIRG